MSILKTSFYSGVLLLLTALPSTAAPNPRLAKFWPLKPVVRPSVPGGEAAGVNPIDAFLRAKQAEKGLQPTGPADKRTLLRRVYLDLIGLPPSPEEQDAFLRDTAPNAYEKVVDKLLASEQHGVRYARHWLDVLRYADVDDRMAAESGIHHWRDWVITALNEDLSYDKFVRAQLTGYRDGEYTSINENGNRSRSAPRPFDLFALGFHARGQVSRDGNDTQELPIAAVETISTAFMGITVGCAKCHDHMYDPVSNRDFYAMKALFDPLTVKRIRLASEQDTVQYDRAYSQFRMKKAAAQKKVEELIAPYKVKLFAHLMETLTPEVQAVFRKPEKQRTAAEQKIADDYHVIFKVTGAGLKPFMTPEVLKQYSELQKAADAIRPPADLAEFWTVEEDSSRLLQPSYILSSGEPTQPQKDKPVDPGFPFQPENLEFRDGRRETFAEWLVAPENPLFARVAANRLWQWHFGKGLQQNASDFGTLGGKPTHPELLDWLASEFVANQFSMKSMHKLMVTSAAYKMASEAKPELVSTNNTIDPANTFLWQFRLLRLEAEPLGDSVHAAALDLDLTVGGKSFQLPADDGKRKTAATESKPTQPPHQRRSIYMQRGYHQSMDVMPNFLQVFDAEDGRAPCPERTRTVTAPQSLFLMNDKMMVDASVKFAERLREVSRGDLSSAVELGYRIALSRPPSNREKDNALSYIENDPGRLDRFTWLLFNLDEFFYAR